MRVGIVVPHIFMHRDILPHVIFSPGHLALDLSAGLQRLGAEVTLFTPGPVEVNGTVRNVTADLWYLEQELLGRGYGYLDLLKKHPLTFITLARQIQSELIARAFRMANDGELDVVHVYGNEEDTALPFAALCNKPTVFTHHDPFNFMVKYKNVFPKYKHLNWISMSKAQRKGMPVGTNWVGNIYHGADGEAYRPVDRPTGNYVAYVGRIIESKGTHLAISAVRRYNEQHPNQPLQLRMAGKHYTGHKDVYWQERIAPSIDGETIIYDGFVGDTEAKRQLLANAQALIVPSVFEEPFGMVMIEALACGTPVIGLDSGAIPEVITDGKTGFVVKKAANEADTVRDLAEAIAQARSINRQACRNEFEARFSLQRMCTEHYALYKSLAQQDSVIRHTTE